MSQHRLAATTHTVEMAQIAAINAALAAAGPTGPSAGDLELHPSQVGPDAVLRRLAAEGDPSFPDVYGVFGAPSASGEVPVPLHTAQLRAVSARLGLHHRWGVA